jgi:hypothetical protein
MNGGTRQKRKLGKKLPGTKSTGSISKLSEKHSDIF